jgi:hypothetical protein
MLLHLKLLIIYLKLAVCLFDIFPVGPVLIAKLHVLENIRAQGNAFGENFLCIHGQIAGDGHLLAVKKRAGPVAMSAEATALLPEGFLSDVRSLNG